MSAGRPEKTLSEPPSNTTHGVHKFAGVADRLAMLAPLHRRAALRRAAKACGHAGPMPSLADLATAEAPPQAEWKMIGYDAPGLPTKTAVEAEAVRVLRDVAWRAALPLMPPGEVKRLAGGVATDRLTAAWQRGPQASYECVNPEAVAEGARLAEAHGRLVAAVRTVLDGLDDVIPQSRLAALPEDEICALAESRAQASRDLADWRAALARKAGREPPETTPEERRMQDPLWRRRQLRGQAGLARQHLAAALGSVGRGGSPYADDYSLARRRERDEAAAAWAAAHEWIGQDGTAVLMSRIRAKAAEGALARLGAITTGVEQVARAGGLVPIFVTLTLPPCWHPAPAVGRRTWTPERGPTQTDTALRQLWGRFRARLHKSGIRCLGLRVWEPHKDGCPHVHALLHVEAGQVAVVDRHLGKLCPEPFPPATDRDGNPKRVASDLVRIDPSRGSGATYVTKYLRKTVGGTREAGEDDRGNSDPHGEGDDHLSSDHFDRTRATASERRWRRYAPLGTHGVGRVWQRLATATEDEVTGAPHRVREAWEALQGHRWGDALTALGAIRVPDAGPRVRLGYETETVDPETGEVLPLTGRYGEPVRRPAWVYDEAEPGWRLSLSRGGSVQKRPEAEKASENNAVTVSESCPRAGQARTAEPVQTSSLEPVTIQNGLAGPLPAACGPPRRSQWRTE